MHTYTDSVLSIAKDISGKLGPVTNVLEGIIKRVVPQTTAQAVCQDILCFTECGVRCSHFANFYYAYYGCTVSDCNTGIYSHIDRTCEC